MTAKSTWAWRGHARQHDQPLVTEHVDGEEGPQARLHQLAADRLGNGAVGLLHRQRPGVRRDVVGAQDDHGGAATQRDPGGGGHGDDERADHVAIVTTPARTRPRLVVGGRRPRGTHRWGGGSRRRIVSGAARMLID